MSTNANPSTRNPIDERISALRSAIIAGLVERGATESASGVTLGGIEIVVTVSEIVTSSTTMVRGWHDHRKTGKIGVEVGARFGSNVRRFRESEPGKGIAIAKVIAGALEWHSDEKERLAYEAAKRTDIDRVRAIIADVNRVAGRGIARLDEVGGTVKPAIKITISDCPESLARAVAAVVAAHVAESRP